MGMHFKSIEAMLMGGANKWDHMKIANLGQREPGGRREAGGEQTLPAGGLRLEDVFSRVLIGRFQNWLQNERTARQRFFLKSHMATTSQS